MEAALLSVICIALICLILGGVIGFIAKMFAVEVDSRVEETGELLPGANCGGCGFAGCADFAKAVVSGAATPDKCPVASPDNISSIVKLLGLESSVADKQVAIVFCGGDNSTAKKSVNYNGVKDCKSAALIATGDKGCSFGCLGLASCARACPFGAIEMKDGLAIVHPNLCVGCGVCVETCPKNLIRLVTADAPVHVFCSSTEKGPVKRKVCSVSCIGCRKCVKVADEDQMIINGFLIDVNYDNFPKDDIIEAAKCPTGCLRTS